MIENLTCEIFARHLNTHFRVEHRGSLLALELIEASEARSTPDAQTFSIVFRGPLDLFLPQAIYRFHHDAIGTFDLFTVPVRRDDQGFYYEAVFNRIVREEEA